MLDQAILEVDEYRSKVPVNAMSVDVEDYFQVSAFETQVDRKHWDDFECRVEATMDRTLQMFADHNVKATFFTLGWVAQRYPNIIRAICDSNHEIASHGMAHHRATSHTPDQFRKDVSQSKDILEQLSGKQVVGYRAASYSVTRDNLWALDILGEEGYQYSSSIYPIAHDHYGIPEAPRFPFRLKHGGILEVPVSTLRFAGKNFPLGGGGYFRLLPYFLSKWGIQRVNSAESLPCVFYFHPWEVDPDQPVMERISSKTRFRHYYNLRNMQKKLEKLLHDFEWDRVDRVYLARGQAD